MAYRLRFSDNHDSNLACAFINLKGVFPIFRVFSEEEDGFRNGKTFSSGDIGNNFRIIFSTTIIVLTYRVHHFLLSIIPQYVSCLLSTTSRTFISNQIELPHAGNSKGHVGDNINSAGLSFIEKISSCRGSKINAIGHVIYLDFE